MSAPSVAAVYDRREYEIGGTNSAVIDRRYMENGFPEADERASFAGRRRWWPACPPMKQLFGSNRL